MSNKEILIPLESLTPYKRNGIKIDQFVLHSNVVCLYSFLQLYDNYYQNDGKFYAILPQGESPYDVALRTKQFIDTIFRDPEEVLFVVSHGTTIRTIILNWFHYAPEWFNSEKLMNNCAVRLITKEKNVSTEEYIYGGVNK